MPADDADIRIQLVRIERAVQSCIAYQQRLMDQHEEILRRLGELEQRRVSAPDDGN